MGTRIGSQRAASFSSQAKSKAATGRRLEKSEMLSRARACRKTSQVSTRLSAARPGHSTFYGPRGCLHGRLRSIYDRIRRWKCAPDRDVAEIRSAWHFGPISSSSVTVIPPGCKTGPLLGDGGQPPRCGSGLGANLSSTKSQTAPVPLRAECVLTRATAGDGFLQLMSYIIFYRKTQACVFFLK